MTSDHRSREPGNLKRREVYLDNQASTPCDPAVIDAMMPFLVTEYANPSSGHRLGARCSKAIDLSREIVSEMLSCSPSEVFFTSGATEANNLALLGCAERLAPGNRLVSTSIEHSSILEPLKRLEKLDFDVSLCPVRGDGLIDLGALSELLDDSVALVSVHFANNEIGTIQPVGEIAQLARRAGALIHVDAAQAFGKLSIDVEELDVDLLSISAHKCYGPKGVGALFVRGGAHSGPIEPLALGGGQEGGLRPGTQNVAGIVGLGRATEISSARMEEDSSRTSRLRNRLESQLLEAIPGTVRNGAPHRRLAGASSLTFPVPHAEMIMGNAPELAISSGSACNSGSIEPSHVLTGIGLARDEAYRTIRFGIGRFTMDWEIEYAIRRLVAVVRTLPGVGPQGSHLTP